MSKYRYRATFCHQVDWERLRQQASGQRLIIPIDVAKEDFFVTVMNADQAVLKTIKWRHPQQTRELIERLTSLGARSLEAVLEPSGTYGDALRYQLRLAGVRVYRISPKRVHDAAEVYDGVPSLHDAKAAYLIGRLHLEGVSQPWEEVDEHRRQLQAPLKRLEWAQELFQRAYNRLDALMARHWPEAPHCLTLQATSLLQLLAHYGDPAAVAAEPERAGQLLRHTGGRWLKSQKIEALVESAATTVGVPMVAGERELIKELARELLQARQQCRRIERHLDEQVRQQAQLALIASVVGQTSAVVLYCALNDPAHYADAASYLKAAGLNLKERSSGKHKGRLKLTKRGPGVARYYLYFAALRLIAQSGPARRWYEAKVARDGGRRGKAITALMRKLAKALWYVAQGARFDQAKLFSAAQDQAQAA